MVVHVLDKYYLAITVLVTIAYQLSGFAIAWILQFDKITDFTGGSNFFLLALLTLLLGNTFYARNIVASALMMIWATRLGGFLLYRVLKRGSDARFDEIRSNFFKFLGFWTAQIVWVWTVSLPVTILNSPAVSDRNIGGNNPKFGQASDIIGIVLFALGFVLESVADAQKFSYKSKNPPKDQPMNTGVWKYSRHPPYAGEITLWWGIWTLCLAPSLHGHISSSARHAQYAALASPLLTMLLLIFASGIPTGEKPVAERYYLLSNGPNAKPGHAQAWDNYKAYIHKTSVLWPVPPSLFVKFPRWLKSTLFLELPMYHFDEVTDGPLAIQKEQEQDGQQLIGHS